MSLHLLEFLVRKASGLAQDSVINRDLSEVMHRRGFDDIAAELLRKSEFVLLHHLVNKDLHNIAGSSDMTAGGIVTAFYHSRHTEDKLVVHLHYMLGFLLYLFTEIGVIRVDKGDVLLILGIIGDKELISAPSLPVVKEVDIYAVYLLPALVIYRIL